MQGACGLERWNECNQIIFNFVWTDIECGKSHDADTSYLLEGNKETEVDARVVTVLKEIEKSGLTEIALMQLKALAMIK